ncbi:MAG: transposase [Planctomycetia bacterium]|nr:transposase [Planctomycetia bacterium]
MRHYDEAGHAHFLTFSCYARLPLLSRDRTRHWFLRSLASAREKHSFDLWAWVIMPEHAHLLIWPRERGYRVAAILADIKRPVAQRAIAWLRERHSPFLERLTVRQGNRTRARFWQAGPGQDRNVYEPEAALTIVEYIHHNPVRRGLVRNVVDWQWSSAADWAGVARCHLQVDRTLPMLNSPGP